MTNKITQIPFRGTPEQEAQLKEVIEQHKGHSDAMMPVLQKAQEIYGYLPIEVQTMVAEGLGVSLEQVYGVSTFYSWFTLEPKGEHLIRVCLGTACYVKGSADILAELERLLGIDRDEAALARQLREGRFAGVALDVFVREPLPADDPLWECPRLLITPHVAGNRA